VIGLVRRIGVTAWDVALKMFPHADDVHRFLSVSEAVAHLDMAHPKARSLRAKRQTEVYKPLLSHA
jgi:hypothetical protein